ncbi:MAG: hypothetical protein ACJATE_000914 [Bacteroidia bacterium]|jgi:hypothetical protein
MFQFPPVGVCRGKPDETVANPSCSVNPAEAVSNRNAKFISNGRSAERPYTFANFLLTSAKVLDEKSGIFDA